MKIWRYMDFAKFISLISKEALYFANPNQFNDPYEFYLPKSHNLAKEEKIYKPEIEKMNNLKKQIILNKPGIEKTDLFKIFEQKIIDLPKQFKNAEKEVKNRFGISCWHINDYENEALWKIYTNQGQGIAIETTSEKLEESLTYHRRITLDKVRYEDFDTAQIEKGHKHYSGFIKRKAFEYEKEYRASLLLDEKDYGKGCFVKADLDILIEKIHVSPLIPEYFLESIKYLCKGELSFLEDRIVQSNLYNEYNNN